MKAESGASPHTSVSSPYRTLNTLEEEMLGELDSDTEDEDMERSALRPLMIISQGSAVVKNTEKQYLQKEWDQRQKLRNRDLQK